MQVRVLRFIYCPFGILPISFKSKDFPQEMTLEASRAFDLVEKILEEIGIPMKLAEVHRLTWRMEIIISADSPREFTFDDAVRFKQMLEKHYIIDRFQMTMSYDDLEKDWADSRPHFEVTFIKGYE